MVGFLIKKFPFYLTLKVIAKKWRCGVKYDIDMVEKYLIFQREDRMVEFMWAKY